MGTTSREASCHYSALSRAFSVTKHTIRELGKTFQLSRRPSRSSISDHCSFSASISMVSGAQSPGPRWLACLLAERCGRGIVQCLGRWGIGPGAQMVRATCVWNFLYEDNLVASRVMLGICRGGTSRLMLTLRLGCVQPLAQR